MRIYELLIQWMLLAYYSIKISARKCMNTLPSNTNSNLISTSSSELEPGFEILPFQRKPKYDSADYLNAIEHRISWLAERGLRPHSNVLKRRDELIALIAEEGKLDLSLDAELATRTT
jgi:hypothetical protein